MSIAPRGRGGIADSTLPPHPRGVTRIFHARVAVADAADLSPGPTALDPSGLEDSQTAFQTDDLP